MSTGNQENWKTLEKWKGEYQEASERETERDFQLVFIIIKHLGLVTVEWARESWTAEQWLDSYSKSVLQMVEARGPKGRLESKREDVDGRTEGFSLRDIIVGGETGTESECWLRILGDGAAFK